MNEQKVFLRAEVVTLDDLIAIRNGYVYLYDNSTNGEARYQFLVAAGVVEQIIGYLKRGKTSIEEIN